ncbi:MAG: hypothetical protein NZZ41_04720 [Candidatus Dojkabacteria bacterium]|nr:hypothetical protein [Candidatus Dojkabacteria bacterium]
MGKIYIPKLHDAFYLLLFDKKKNKFERVRFLVEKVIHNKEVIVKLESKSKDFQDYFESNVQLCKIFFGTYNNKNNYPAVLIKFKDPQNNRIAFLEEKYFMTSN